MTTEATVDTGATKTGFNAMGSPVPTRRLTNALHAMREMVPGITTERAMTTVGRVAAQLERDEPYEAQNIAREVLDLTGAYRLIATLLSG